MAQPRIFLGLQPCHLTPRPACGEWTSSEIMDAFGDIHS
jgi:hypothetical protein